MTNSRAKGGKNEREIAKLFETWTGYEFTRTPSSGGLRWSRVADTTGDVICADKNHYRRFPLSVEAKNYKEIKFEHVILPNTRVIIFDFWEQAVDDAVRGEKIPVLFMRYNQMPKNVHFVAFDIEFYRDVLFDLIDTKHGSFDIYHDRMEASIINSKDLFDIDYLTFYKAAKKWLRKKKKKSGA